MEVRNRDGDPIDPVPFLVSAGLTVMLTVSVGPLYGLAYGVAVEWSLAVSGLAAVGVSVVAYHRLIWTATPKSVTVPPALRFERLIYIAIALALVLVALSLPLVR